MSRRRVESFAPFSFQSDFAPPPETPVAPGPDRLSISAVELAALFAEARAEGAAQMAAMQSGEGAAHVADAVEKLNAALGDLVSVAEHLETHAEATGASADVRRLIGRAAQRIIDGQGDLFARRRVAE